MQLKDKYEPKQFSDLIFADPIARNTCYRYATSTPSKPLMLWGPPGTAKTTTARVILAARCGLEWSEIDYPEFNGAEITSADFTKLENTANWLSLNGQAPIVLLNEFDEIEKADQPRFRAWMDRNRWLNLIVTTNEKPGVSGTHQKIMPALVSRFELVELDHPSVDHIIPRVQEIFESEGHPVAQSQLRRLLGDFSGDLRDMIPVIEQVMVQMTHNPPQPTPRPPQLTVVP